jgi:hypothetical protein
MAIKQHGQKRMMEAIRLMMLIMQNWMRMDYYFMEHI